MQPFAPKASEEAAEGLRERIVIGMVEIARLLGEPPKRVACHQQAQDKWTEEQLNKPRECIASGMSAAKIHKDHLLERTVGAIRARQNDPDINPPDHQSRAEKKNQMWTDDKDAELRRLTTQKTPKLNNEQNNGWP